jgi:hypothetical protein
MKIANMTELKTISFTLNDETHKHLFYVHTTKEFNFLSDYFEK